MVQLKYESGILIRYTYRYTCLILQTYVLLKKLFPALTKSSFQTSQTNCWKQPSKSYRTIVPAVVSPGSDSIQQGWPNISFTCQYRLIQYNNTHSAASCSNISSASFSMVLQRMHFTFLYEYSTCPAPWDVVEADGNRDRNFLQRPGKTLLGSSSHWMTANGGPTKWMEKPASIDRLTDRPNNTTRLPSMHLARN